jgi:membrane fusion protein (multidrug efflux system)
MNMKKYVILAIVGLVILTGALTGIKALQFSRMADQGRKPQPEIVTTAVANTQVWESTLTAVGSLVAVQGVMIAAEMTGKMVKITFEPGSMVKAGDLLVQQDTAAEEAELRSAEATVGLTRLTFERARRLLAEGTFSQAEYDKADAEYKQALAQTDNIRAVIAKKTIRAPFSGLLGIRLVNLGQMLSPGDEIVSLQALDPIFANFSLPQQQFPRIRPDLEVRVETDALPGEIIKGKITAINPQVETATRNIMAQATVPNGNQHLRPGMFVNVTVLLPEHDTTLVIPATAVLNAPYSDSVFIVENDASDKKSPPGTVVRQQFVKLGERRGDFIAVIAGLKEGETVVSTGVFKLRNGQAVSVDNTLAPAFNLSPTPKDT